MDLQPYLGTDGLAIAAIIAAYRRTYDVNVRRFDPKVGDDQHTFGSQNWRNGLFHLEREFVQVPGVKITRPANHMRILLPTGVALIPYKAQFDGENLAFPPTSRARARVSQGNAISFFEYSKEFREGMLPVRELVIQHDGDTVEGLVAIYVGAPLDGRNPENGWFFSEQIYDRGAPPSDGERAPAPDGPTDPIVPFTEQQTPDIPIVAEADAGEETSEDPR